MDASTATPYTQLRAQVQRQRETGIATTLDWRSIFQFSGHAQKNHPYIVVAIADALEKLSATPHGQQLFHDILMNPAYTQPVTIFSAHVGGPILANFTYMSKGLPLLGFNPEMFEEFFLRRDQAQLTERYGAPLALASQSLKAALMHEGDHLARTTPAIAGVVFGKNIVHAQEASACSEHLAVQREDIQRRHEGLTLRRIYRDTDAEFSVLLKEQPALMKTLRQIHTTRTVQLSDIPESLRHATQDLAFTDQPCTHLDETALNAAILKRWHNALSIEPGNTPSRQPMAR